MNVYVASSWRNEYQPGVVESLRARGHDVYDFRNPAPGDHGFAWAEIDPAWKGGPVEVEAYCEGMRHPIAVAGFSKDLAGMHRAHFGVLVLPSGRSAHLEAGWMLGQGIPVGVYMPVPSEPELMYHLALSFGSNLDELVSRLEHFGRRRHLNHAPIVESLRRMVRRMRSSEVAVLPEGATEEDGLTRENRLALEEAEALLRDWGVAR